MSSNHHTPLVDGPTKIVNAALFEGPLGELDAAIDLATTKVRAETLSRLAGSGNVESLGLFNVTHVSYGAKGDGLTDDRGAINTAATVAAGAGPVVFPPGSYLVGSNLTLAANVAVQFEHGAKLIVPSGVTVTINGPITAGRWQIFECQGTGSVAITASDVWVHWFGAKPDDVDPDADAYTPFVKAVAAIQGASNRTLKLGNGTFTFWSKNATQDAMIYLDKTISLVGEKRCILKPHSTLTPAVLLKVDFWGDATYKFSPHEIGGFELDGDDVTRPFRVAKGLLVEWDSMGRYADIRVAGAGIGFEAGLAAYDNSGIWLGTLQDIYVRGEDQSTNYMDVGYNFLKQCNGLRVSNCYATYCNTCFVTTDANYCNLDVHAEDSALGYSLKGLNGSRALLSAERLVRFADVESCRGLALDVCAYVIGKVDPGKPATLLNFKGTVNEVTITSFVWSAVASGYTDQVVITQTDPYGSYLFAPVTGLMEALKQDTTLDWVQWANGGAGALASDSASATGAISPDALGGARTVWKMKLTGDVTIGVPLRPQKGQRLTFVFRQDGTGGHSVTWNGYYHTTWTNTGNTANRWSMVEFVFLGNSGEGMGELVQLGSQLAWMA